jgi:methylthioribulose-1-phosphate dehydratase
MKPEDIYVLSLKAQTDPKQRIYLRSPPSFKPSQCTPLFLAAFNKRKAGCCIHTHSQWAVLITLLLEQRASDKDIFEINNIEQIKGFGKGYQKTGNLGYHDTLRIPVIENTPFEEDLTDSLEAAMDKYPDTYAVLVRRHGIYVWGETVHKAKTQCERQVDNPHLTTKDLTLYMQFRLSLPACNRDEETQSSMAKQHRIKTNIKTHNCSKNQFGRRDE